MRAHRNAIECQRCVRPGRDRNAPGQHLVYPGERRKPYTTVEKLAAFSSRNCDNARWGLLLNGQQAVETPQPVASGVSRIIIPLGTGRVQHPAHVGCYFINGLLAARSKTVAALYERRTKRKFWPKSGGHGPPLQPRREFINGLLGGVESTIPLCIEQERQ